MVLYVFGSTPTTNTVPPAGKTVPTGKTNDCTPDIFQPVVPSNKLISLDDLDTKVKLS